MSSIRRTIPKGFTLVELLIVVIILALLAAIVVPQFSASTDDARRAALDTTLQRIRSAIDLYYQHHGEYPSANTAVPGACGGTPGAGAADSEAAFVSQLTLYTNAAGEACSQQGTEFIYGPYFKAADMPNNPITENNAVVIVNTGDLNLGVTTPGTPEGWRFDNQSGRFIADDDTDPDAGGPLPPYNEW